MWTLHTMAGSGYTEYRHLLRDGQPMSFGEVASAWQSDADFCQFWTDALRALPFAAFCWETPPIATDVLSQPFTSVFVDSPALERSKADSAPFARQFDAQQGKHVIAFENLGRDALLVVPCPTGQKADYCHLATFLRTATDEQCGALWACVGESLLRRAGSRPFWLSTAGLGVSWLHVRFGVQPKYYRHRPYTSASYWDDVTA